MVAQTWGDTLEAFSTIDIVSASCFPARASSPASVLARLARSMVAA